MSPSSQDPFIFNIRLSEHHSGYGFFPNLGTILLMGWKGLTACPVLAGYSGQCPMFTPHLCEGLHAPVDVVLAVDSGDLYPDPCLPLRNHRVAEADDINAWGCESYARVRQT